MGQFKTDLTLAELEVLISGSLLNIGLQYYVTDKDWLLYATSVNTLKPVKGSLHIFNGETLPTGIEPDVLFIDTGIIDWDISNETGVSIILSVVNNYVPVNLFSHCISNNDVLDIQSAFNRTSFIHPTLVGSKVKYLLYDEIISPNDSDNWAISATNHIGDTCRFIVEFHRSELSYPIPVPHIVNAEMNSSNNVWIDVDIQLNLVSILENGSDVIVKVNGLENPQDGGLDSANDSYTISVFLQNEINYGDIVTVSISSGNIKNTWGGLLEAVVDYPVVNNVPES